MYYVYLIVNEKKQKYVGYTNNLERRLNEHNNNENQSTKNHEWQLAYYEAYKSERDARERESKLKQRGSSKQKLYDRIVESIKECFL